MKNKIFTMRDQKLGYYERPFACPTDKAAMRELQSEVEAGNGSAGKYPADWDLYEIGTFDIESGIIRGYDTPKHITSALAFEVKKSPLAEPMPLRDHISL
jgi:hypothetical protein